jgi:hypothetical protein
MRGIADSIDLCLREIIESPVSLINRDSERSAIAPMMVLSELRDGNNFLVIFDDVKQPEMVS